MTHCPHCGYSDSGVWQECPACGQYAAPDAQAPAPYMTAPAGPPTNQPPPPGYGPPPYGAPGPAAYPSTPGDNPYAAPSAAGAYPPVYGYAYQQPSLLPTSGKAIASMVIGICSIVIYFLGFILGPLAIGLWASARNDFKQIPPSHKGQGLATAGLVTGILGTLIGLFMVIVIVMAFVMASRQNHYPPP